MDPKIMYVELKTGWNDDGPAWITRVTYSKSGLTIYVHDRELRRIKRGGVRGNYRDVATGDEYWVSGPKRNGHDRHGGEGAPVTIDADVAAEYAALRAAGS